MKSSKFVDNLKLLTTTVHRKFIASSLMKFFSTLSINLNLYSWIMINIEWIEFLDFSFTKCISIKKIIIPHSVTLIGNFTFYKCISLEEITIPHSVTSIGEGCFYGCTSLKQMLIPSSVKVLGRQCLKNAHRLQKFYSKCLLLLHKLKKIHSIVAHL